MLVMSIQREIASSRELKPCKKWTQKIKIPETSENLFDHTLESQGTNACIGGFSWHLEGKGVQRTFDL